jgi:hypothetical protein
MTQFSMGYPDLGLKFQMVQHGTKKWSKYKMAKNDEKKFFEKKSQRMSSAF